MSDRDKIDRLLDLVGIDDPRFEEHILTTECRCYIGNDGLETCTGWWDITTPGWRERRQQWREENPVLAALDEMVKELLKPLPPMFTRIAGPKDKTVTFEIRKDLNDAD